MFITVVCPRCHQESIRVRTHESHQGVVACDEARQACRCWLTTEEIWEAERAAIRQAQDRHDLRRALEPPTWEVPTWAR